MQALSFRTIRALVMIVLVVIVGVWVGLVSFRQPSSGQTTADAAAMCHSQTHLSAPAYTAGSQPPLALYARSDNAASERYQGVYVLGAAPRGTDLQADYSAVGQQLSKTYSAKQTPVLVACVTRSQETLTSQTCQYNDGKTIPVYTAVYQLTVYEARSRRAVKTVAVPTQPAYTCQSLVAYDGKGFYHDWDKATVVQALAPLIK